MSPPVRISVIVSVALTVASSLEASTAARFAMSLGLVIGIVTITLLESEDERRKLMEEVVTDPLTGTYNRRHLETSMRMAAERRSRMSEPASLLVVDIDHFKHINDSFGHIAGDEVLKRLVRTVAGRMRALDLLFRIGGDEFAVLLSGAQYHDALLVAEDLRLLVEEWTLVNDGRLSISIGVSELKRGQPTTAWLAEADAALYRAKCGGRNRIGGAAFVSTPSVPEPIRAQAATSPPAIAKREVKV
jgi:diguanylate cyclase (GGDEF)-like protein